MKTGIEKNQILRTLNGMVHNLEEAEATLHDTLADFRTELWLTQSSSLTNLETRLVTLQSKGDSDQFIGSAAVQDYNDAAGLKLELGF